MDINNKKIKITVALIIVTALIGYWLSTINTIKLTKDGIPLDDKYRDECPFSYATALNTKLAIDLSTSYTDFKSEGSSCSLESNKVADGEKIYVALYSKTIQDGLDKFVEVVKGKGIDIDPASIDYQWFNPALEGLRPEQYPPEYQFKYCVGYEYMKHGVNHTCLDFSPSPLLIPELERYYKENNLEVIGDINRKIINTVTGEIVDNDGP